MDSFEKEKILLIDQFIAKSGEFHPLDFCIEQGWLDYRDYDQWRKGDMLFLDQAFRLSFIELRDRMQACQQVAIQFNLSPSHWLVPSPRGGEQQLRASQNSDLNSLLMTHYKRKRTEQLAEKPVQSDLFMGQADLFIDSPEVSIENDLIDALVKIDEQRADQKIEALYRYRPDHPNLGEYEAIVGYLHHINSINLSSLDELMEEKHGLETELEPIIKSRLAEKASPFLKFAWHQLAEQSIQFNYNALVPDSDTAYYFFKAAEYQQSLRYIKMQSGFEQIPRSLELATKCCLLLNDKFQAYWLLSILCWYHGEDSERLEEEIERIVELDRHLSVQWDQFLQMNWPLSDFPALLLIGQSAMAQYFNQQSKIDMPKGFQLLLALIIAERQQKSHIDLPARKALQQAHTAMLNLYLANRS